MNNNDSKLQGTSMEEPVELTFQDVREITDDFSEERIVGAGGFGIVYKVWSGPALLWINLIWDIETAYLSASLDIAMQSGRHTYLLLNFLPHLIKCGNTMQ